MKIRLIPFVICICVSALALMGVIYSKKLEVEEHHVHEKVMANDRLSLVAMTLSLSVNTRLNNTQSLAAFVKANPNFTQEEFNVFATTLQKDLIGLRSLQLAPKGIITYLNLSD